MDCFPFFPLLLTVLPQTLQDTWVRISLGCVFIYICKKCIYLYSAFRGDSVLGSSLLDDATLCLRVVCANFALPAARERLPTLYFQTYKLLSVQSTWKCILVWFSFALLLSVTWLSIFSIYYSCRFSLLWLYNSLLKPFAHFPIGWFFFSYWILWWSCLKQTHENQPCPSLPVSTLCDVTLVAWNWSHGSIYIMKISKCYKSGLSWVWSSCYSTFSSRPLLRRVLFVCRY